MTDTDILDQWREAENAYLRSTHEERPEAMFAKMAAEQAAIERFGMDLYLRAYYDRFGDVPADDPPKPSRPAWTTTLSCSCRATAGRHRRAR